MPVAGGTYVYVDRSMGPWMGTIAGLGTWFSLASKVAFALVGLGAYLAIFSALSGTVFALSVLAALLLLNIVGVGKASGVQILIVTISLVALVIFAIYGSITVDPAKLEPAFPKGFAGILSGAGFVFVSYSGVTKVCSVAEEIRDPDRNIPLGIMAALFTVMVLYVVISWVIMGNISYTELTESVTPVAEAGEALLGRPGQVAMAIIAIVGLISMCNAGVLATSRFPFAMSRDHLLPPGLARINSAFGTPLPAILFTGALLFLLVTMMPVVKLAKLASGFKIFIFCVVNVSVIILRESHARWYKPSFKSPFYPWTQLIGVIGGLIILASLGAYAVKGVGAAVVVGSLWYLLYGRQRVKRSGALSHVLTETRALRATRFAELETDMLARSQVDDAIPHVLVPVFGGEPAPGRLLRLACAFIDHGSLEVLRLDEVPEQLSLSTHLDPAHSSRRLQKQSDLLAQDSGLDVRFRDLVTHNAKRALLDEAHATGADWIVMEWPSRRELHYLVRHPLALWLDDPPCDMAIFTDRDGWDPDGPADADPRGTLDGLRVNFSGILVLAAPGPFDTLVMHVADRLARLSASKITLFLAVPTDTDRASIAAYEDYHSHLSDLCRAGTKSMIVKTDDLLGTITEVSRKFDLLIMGASAEHSWRSLIVPSRAWRIADSAACSVLRVKESRSTVHHRQRPPDVGGPSDVDVARILKVGTHVARLAVSSKSELFARMAEQLAVGRASANDIEKALWERENRQNTALPTGMALSGLTALQIEGTKIGVFTLERGIDFGPPDRRSVDLCIVVMAPPSERRTQLMLLDRLSRMVLRTELLTGLREAGSSAQVKLAVLDADDLLRDL